MWYVVRVFDGRRCCWGFGATLREAELEARRHEAWSVGRGAKPTAVMIWHEQLEASVAA